MPLAIEGEPFASEDELLGGKLVVVALEFVGFVCGEPAADVSELRWVHGRTGELLGGVLQGFFGVANEDRRVFRSGSILLRGGEFLRAELLLVSLVEAMERSAMGLESEAVWWRLGEFFDGSGITEIEQPIVDSGLLIFGQFGEDVIAARFHK